MWCLAVECLSFARSSTNLVVSYECFYVSCFFSRRADGRTSGRTNVRGRRCLIHLHSWLWTASPWWILSFSLRDPSNTTHFQRGHCFFTKTSAPDLSYRLMVSKTWFGLIVEQILQKVSAVILTLIGFVCFDNSYLFFYGRADGRTAGGGGAWYICN